MPIATGKRQSKTVTFVYGALAALLLLVVAAVALVVVPPSPPSISEFAPQAIENIVQAPDQQSSQFGSGAGACAAGQVCEGPDGAAIPLQRKVIEKARVRRCVGDPPRQIEDPQSPPCVNYFEGDNGGATWKGVTRDEIRVVYPCPFCTEVDDRVKKTTLLVNFFNRRFEFYGRKIKLVLMKIDGGTDVPAQRAFAQRADEELAAFASLPLTGGDSYRADNAYNDELARRKVMSVGTIGFGFSERTEDDYRRTDPFAWNIMASDKLQKSQAEWLCNSLVGKPAAYGGPDVSTSKRVFGIARDKSRSAPSDVQALYEGLSRCGAKPAKVVDFDESGSSATGASDSTKLAMNDLRLAGVTSVMCFCLQSPAMRGASDVQYTPEWLLTRTETDSGLGPKEQNSHIFGITPKNKRNPIADRPYYWALRESDPSTPYHDDGNVTAGLQYQALLLLASGIQMAGPGLSPHAFRDGLVKTGFPNPGAGSPPYYQATVGFRPGDHSMFQDFAMVWWNEVAEPSYADSPQVAPGAWCYVEKGIRYGLGQWPRQDPGFFDRAQPCR